MGPSIVALSTRVTAASNTAETWYIPQPLEGTWRIKAAYLLDHDGITASDTDYRTFTLRKGTTAIATDIVTNVAGLGFTAGTARAISLLASAGTSLDCAQGEAWNLLCAEANTGPVVNADLTIVIEKVL